jgi:hypothetical protein
MTDRELMQQALERYGGVDQRACDAEEALRERLAQPEPVQCEPQEALEDGWCDWVCPKPQGYLMQCCDCGLIHEVESRVAKYEPRPSEVFEVVDDPDLQVQWRMKRRDDLSPQREWVGLTDEELKPLCDENHIMFGAYTVDFIQAIEAKLKEKNA